jgi:hypothetical protein
MVGAAASRRVGITRGKQLVVLVLKKFSESVAIVIPEVETRGLLLLYCSRGCPSETYWLKGKGAEVIPTPPDRLRDAWM